MRKKIWISLGAVVLGVSTFTVGYAASGRGEGSGYEKMMREHGGAQMHHPMGMMGCDMHKRCDEMMKRRGMPATELPGATAPAI